MSSTATTTTELNAAIRAAGAASDALAAAEAAAAQLRQRVRTKDLVLVEAALWPDDDGEAQDVEQRRALAIADAEQAERHVQHARLDWVAALEAVQTLLRQARAEEAPRD